MKSVIEKFTPNNLSWEDRARFKLLPDVLLFDVIARLWKPDDAEIYSNALLRAISEKDLKIHQVNWSDDEERFYMFCYGAFVRTSLVHKDEFKRWFISHNNEWPLPDDCLLANWWSDPAKKVVKKRANKTTAPRSTNLTKAIHAAIDDIGYKPSLDELMKYFNDDRDTTEHIDDYGDSFICWRDKRGNTHEVKRKTIGNKLGLIKV